MANNNNFLDQLYRTFIENETGDITAEVVRDAFITAINNMGGATYKGLATTSTNPGNPDGNVFYIATQSGTYTNFSNINVSANIVTILRNTDSGWVADNVIQLKTVNNETLFGNGNIDASGGGGSVDAYTKAETNNLLDEKQDTLTAGDNITISSDGTISASGGGEIPDNSIAEVKLNAELRTKIDSKLDDTDVRSFTQAEWDALTTEQQNSYLLAIIT